MLFIHARNLTADDMASIGNNVLPAVRRDRRPRQVDPALPRYGPTDHGRRPCRPTVLKFGTSGTSPAA